MNTESGIDNFPGNGILDGLRNPIRYSLPSLRFCENRLYSMFTAIVTGTVFGAKHIRSLHAW